MLSRKEREFLKGERISKDYEYKLVHTIRSKLLQAAEDIQLLANSEHLTKFGKELAEVGRACYAPLLSITGTSGRGFEPRRAKPISLAG